MEKLRKKLKISNLLHKLHLKVVAMNYYGGRKMNRLNEVQKHYRSKQEILMQRQAHIDMRLKFRKIIRTNASYAFMAAMYVITPQIFTSELIQKSN